MDRTAEEKRRGERLTIGSKKGTLSPTGLVEPLAFLAHRPDHDGSLTITPRAVKPSEQLVVVSQDCDIVAAEDLEPCIEVFIVERRNEKSRGRVEFGSRRYFVIDPGTGLVAKAAQRLFIAKTSAWRFEPHPWPTSEVRFRRFARWLGER